jgi:hypothetical protein
MSRWFANPRIRLPVTCSARRPRTPLVGQTHTARVITAAAAIMIAVFITFVFTGQVDIAEFGIGLAAAMPPDGRPPSTTVKLRTNVQSTTPRCS